jgi:hypothetical protein
VLADNGDVDAALGQRRGDRQSDQTAADDDNFAAQLGRSWCLLS